MLAMLSDLSERMCKMESAQLGQVGQQRSGTFDSILDGRGGMDLRAMEHIPPLNISPNVSTNGARRPAGGSGQRLGTAPGGPTKPGAVPGPVAQQRV